MAKVKVYTDVVRLNIEDVHPYWNNPRENQKTREALVDAYREIGFNQPIVVDKENVIVKGHARYYAAKIAGMTKIPAIVSTKNDQANREDRILDNGIQDLSTWDHTKLREQLANIDFEIAHLVQTQEAVQSVDTSIDKEVDPVIYLVCPDCGREYQIAKNDILVKDEIRLSEDDVTGYDEGY